MILSHLGFLDPNSVWLQPLLDECAGGWGTSRLQDASSSAIPRRRKERVARLGWSTL